MAYTYASINTPEGNPIDGLYKIILMPGSQVWITASTDDFVRLTNAGVCPGFIRDFVGGGQDIDGNCFLSLDRSECNLHTLDEANDIIRDGIILMFAEQISPD